MNQLLKNERNIFKFLAMDKKILLLLFLVSGFAFSQTTVTLQDQCNCEVLSGTAVTSPGTTTPSGADTGDIYVNTNTGVIYFWDGDSWELTSSDDQLLQNFSFNSGTNILSLDIEDGNTVNVDLSSLSGTGTDDQGISLAGNILTLEDGGTVDLSPYLDNTDDQIITAFSIDAGNILTLTLEDGNTQTVDLSGLVGTDDQTAAEVTYDNTASGLTATDVQAAIDEINALAGTVALVDNLDGTYDFTDAAGNTTTISDTSISTLVDNLDGTYTYTDETGATQLIDTNASSNPYDNTASGLTATDVQAAIDEINALAGTVALVDNLDGTYDFTDAAGNTTTISDTSISTLVDNLDGTYTYTDETGATQLIDTNASSNPYDNTASGLTATDVQAAIDEINALAGTVALVDNLDGTYDFTDAAGNTTTISDTSISTLVDNLDGTYTYTDETGATQLIDTNASSNPYDNTASGLTATDVQAAIDEINALAGTVALVDNLDGTYDFTDAAGNTTTISDTSISTLVDNLDGTYTYTDETGATQLIDTNASSNPYDNTASGLTATDVQAAIDEINALAGTVALVDNLDGTYDFTDAAGNTTTISDTSISTLVDNGDGSFSYTDETGLVTIFTETLTTLVDNFNGTFTYTNEDGVAQIVSKSDIIDNFDGTYVFNNNDGSPETIDTRAISNPYDNTTSGLTAIDVQAAIDEINALAGTVALVDNLDGTYDFTDAAGNTTTISDTSISTLVDNLDGTYTYTDETGATQLIDTNASSNPYDNTASGLTATDVQAAIDEINALAGTVALVDNLDGTYDFTDAAGNTTIITDTSISTLVDNADGTYTYTDESGVTQLIDTNASSNPYDNTASGLTATDVQAAIDEINALAGTVALVDNLDGTYDFTDAAGNTTIITDTSISTLVDNADGTYTYTDETGATQLIDTNASSNPYDNTASGLTATDVQAALDELAAGSTDDQNISGSGLAGTDLTIGIENGTNEVVDLSSLVESVIAGTGAISVTDDGNGNYTVNSTDPDEDLTNELTLLGNGAPVVVPSNAGVTYVDTVAGQLYVWDGAVWNVVGGNASPDLDGDPANELNTTFAVNAGNLEITDNGGTLAVPLASLGTDDQTAAEVTYDNTASGLIAADVQAAIDELDAAAGNVALVDNLDGTYTFTDAAGNPTIISDTSVSTIVDNGDGTYTYTDETGATQTIDTNASSNPYDNTASGLVATDVQAAIDELDAAAGNVALVDNLDGTYTFTDAAGNPTIISDTSISTMLDNGDGTYTYTDESGATQTIDTNASSNPYDNTTSGLVATDVQAALDEVAAGSTDDQNISGSGLAGTDLTIGIENGTNEVVDLSSLVETVIAGTGAITVTDDGNGNYTVNSTDPDEDLTNELTLIGAGAPVVVPSNAGVTYVDSVAGQLYIWDGAAWNAVGGNASPDLDGDPTNEYNTGISFDGTNLTVTDAGGNQVVDISGVSTDDQTAAEVTYDNTTSGLTATEVQAALDEVAAGSTDDQNIESLAVDAGTNILTVGIENGTSQTVDLSHLDDAGTDDQTAAEVSYDNTVSGLTATEVQAALDEVAAGSTDDQNIAGSGLAGNILTIGIENGTNETVDLSALVGTDDQIASEVNITDAGGNFVSTEVEGALAELAVGSTDDQNISGSGLAGNILTIGIENGTNETVDLSALVGTDDQTSAEVTYDNTVSGLTAIDVKAALDELASGSTDDQNIAGSGLAGNILTIGIENGTNETVDLSALVGTDDQIANEVNITDAGGNFVSTEVEGALAELAAGSTDDQNIAGSGLAGNILTIGIENGTNETVDLSALVGTDDQDLTGATLSGANVLQIDIENGGSTTVDLSSLDDSGTDDQTAAEVTYDNTASGLTATEVQAALDEVAAGSTDDQNIAGSGLAGNILTIGIENGTNETVDLSALVGTDDQNISGSGLSGTDLTIGIENGTNEIVDLSSLVETVVAGTGAITVTDDGNGNYTVNSTDPDEDLTNELTLIGAGAPAVVPSNSGVTYVDSVAGQLYIWDGATWNAVGGSASPDLDGDPTNERNTAFAVNAGNLEITDSGGTLSVPLTSLGTDDQNIAGSGLAGNILTIGIENGTNETVDLSALVGTDDQTAAEVTYDNTVSGLTAIDVKAALDELASGSTDDQNIAGSGLAGNILTIGIENGTNETVDLSALVGTDDQIANEVNITDAGGNFVSTEVEGALAELAAGSTDDQNIAGSGLAGNILTIGIENGTNETVDLSALVGTDDQDLTGATLSGANVLQIDIENGGSTTVDLSSLDDSGTDDQNIAGSGLAGNILTIGIENGTNETVDLSALVGTDDQIANEVNITDAGGNFVSTEVEGALAELAAGSTDDQNIAGSGLAGNILTIGIENGTNETVDLSALVGTDDQDLTGATLSGANVLQIDIENGGSTTVDLSSLDDSGTDDQNIAGSGLAGNILTIGIENGTNETVDLSALVGTDDQIANEVNITDAGGNFVSTEVEGALAELAAGSTDDQNIAGSGLAGNILTIGIENGTNETVDLSALVGTDDQDLTGATLSGANVLQIDIENGGSTTVDLSSLDDSGTDDQNIAGSGLAGNILTIGIENGTNETVDLSALVGTDDQIANEVNITDAGGNFVSTEVEGALAELAAGSTDDQNIAGSGLAGNILNHRN